MKHIELSRDEWDRIRDQLRADFGFSMPLLRDRMKRELGFTVREHKRMKGSMDGYLQQRTVFCIDFYSEEAKVWFTLKYL